MISTPTGDPMTGHLLPGAKLPGAGNPLAKAHYQYRKAFIDACTPEEWDEARAKLVAGHDERQRQNPLRPSRSIRASCVASR